MAYELDPEGRRKLYERLVESYSANMYRLAYRLCGERHVAEDMVQEAFTEAWRSLGTLRREEAAGGWLLQILRHVWYRVQRKNARQVPRQDVAVESLELPTAGDLSGSEDRLQEALDQINPLQLEAFLMVAMEGFHCAEVAQLQHVPTGTVLSRIHRARQALRRLLGQEEKETLERPKLRLLQSRME